MLCTVSNSNLFVLQPVSIGVCVLYILNACWVLWQERAVLFGSARASRVSAYWCPHRFLRSQLLLKVGARPTKNWMQKVWVLGEVSLSIYVDLRATIT